MDEINEKDLLNTLSRVRRGLRIIKDRVKDSTDEVKKLDEYDEMLSNISSDLAKLKEEDGEPDNN